MQGRDDKYIQNFVRSFGRTHNQDDNGTKIKFLGVKQDHVSETVANAENSLRAEQVRGIS